MKQSRCEPLYTCRPTLPFRIAGLSGIYTWSRYVKKLVCLLWPIFAAFPAVLTAADYVVQDLKSVDNSADYLVIAPQKFVAEVSILAEHRKQQGLVPAIAVLEKIVTAFGKEGQPDEERIREFIVSVYHRWKEPKLKFVLLVGDAMPAVDGKYPPNTVPTFWRKADFLGEIAASDNPYGCPGDSEIPALMVGRLPADTETELRVMTEKIIAYETNLEPGIWRRRLNFIAGEGRFGPIFDALLEGIFIEILSRELPYTFDVTATYAQPQSPYCYVFSEFSDKVIERLNEGCLAFTYVGHGLPRSLDDLRYNNLRFPILSVEDVKKVNIGVGNPLVIVLACSTGHFDDPRHDCIGEEIIKTAKGPIGFIGASRVSQPYSNAILGLELIHAIFKQNQDGMTVVAKHRTIGELLREAKRALIEDSNKEIRQQLEQLRAAVGMPAEDATRQRKEQLLLYNLLGDPATRLAFIEHTVELTIPEVPGGIKAGASFKVEGRCPEIKTGTAVLTLECERRKIIFPIKKVKDPTDPKMAKRIKTNYANANNKVVVRIDRVAVADGRFTETISVPADTPAGTYYVKCYAASDETDAVGCVKIEIVD